MATWLNKTNELRGPKLGPYIILHLTNCCFSITHDMSGGKQGRITYVNGAEISITKSKDGTLLVVSIPLKFLKFVYFYFLNGVFTI